MKTRDQRKIVTILKNILKERQRGSKTNGGDFLDEIIKDMETEKFLSEDFIVRLIFGGLFGTFESISSLIALAFKLLSEHPSVLEEMIVSTQSLRVSLGFVLQHL